MVYVASAVALGMPNPHVNGRRVGRTALRQHECTANSVSVRGWVSLGLLPPASPQFNILNSYQALAGADISSLEQERHDHLSLLCACTE